MTGGAVLGGIGGMRFHRPSTRWGSAADTHQPAAPPQARAHTRRAHACQCPLLFRGCVPESASLTFRWEKSPPLTQATYPPIMAGRRFCPRWSRLTLRLIGCAPPGAADQRLTPKASPEYPQSGSDVRRALDPVCTRYRLGNAFSPRTALRHHRAVGSDHLRRPDSGSLGCQLPGV